jgi:hypothetical protein
MYLKLKTIKYNQSRYQIINSGGIKLFIIKDQFFSTAC